MPVRHARDGSKTARFQASTFIAFNIYLKVDRANGNATASKKTTERSFSNVSQAAKRAAGEPAAERGLPGSQRLAGAGIDASHLQDRGAMAKFPALIKCSRFWAEGAQIW